MSFTPRNLSALLSALGFILALFLVSCSGDDPVAPVNPVPTITGLVPDHALAGSGSFELTVEGFNFTPRTALTWNGVLRSITYQDTTRLKALILAGDLDYPRNARIQVANPTPGGGPSNADWFTVLPVDNVPFIESLDPEWVSVGERPDLLVHGQGFVGQSVVQFNGEDRPTTFLGFSDLQVELLEEDVNQVGTISVTVLNPETAGGASISRPLTVGVPNPVPVLTSVTPDTIPADTYYGSPVTVTLAGSGFMVNSAVLFSDSTMTATYVSETELQVTLSRSFLTQTGTREVVVRNPAPGGGDSAAVPLTVKNNLPGLREISTGGAAMGSGPLVLVVEGLGFSRSSVVRWNRVDLFTEFESSYRLQATIGESELSQAGMAEISVFNPPPGGGLTGSLNFHVHTEIALATNRMIYDPHRHRIYASVPDLADSYGGSIVVLVPETGEVERSVFVGDEPSTLSISADGYYLYVARSEMALVTRLVLDTMSSNLTFILGAGEDGTYFAGEMMVMPEDRSTIAVARYYSNPSDFAGVGIYENGVMRPNETSDRYGPTIIAHGGLPGRIFGYEGYGGSDGSYIMEVDDSGVSELEVIRNPPYYCGYEIVYLNGYIYSWGGTIIDPVDASLVGSYPARGTLAPVESLNKVFFIDSDSYDRYASICNMTTREEIGTIEIGYFSEWPKDLIYPGGDRLVYRANDSTVIILESPLIGEPAR